MGLVSSLSLANHSYSGSFLVAHALLSQDGFRQGGFWEVSRICDVSFWPFQNSSCWWCFVSSVFLTRISYHKITHANDYCGAWPGWVVSANVSPNIFMEQTDIVIQPHSLEDCANNLILTQWTIKSILNIHWKDWCWSRSSNTLATWCEEPIHWKDPDSGKDWVQEEKRETEDEMAGWHHWLNGHEFEQAPRDSEGQGSLVCCSWWGCRESYMTWRLNSN